MKRHLLILVLPALACAAIVHCRDGGEGAGGDAGAVDGGPGWDGGAGPGRSTSGQAAGR